MQSMRTIVIAFLFVGAALPQTPKGWVKGKGYGWVYGQQDEVGSLNAINTPAQILKALQSVKTGKIYDLGVPVDKRSYKWPGHASTEVMSYRSPDGVKRQRDIGAFAGHPKQMAFHSCAIYTSDNIGTQIDSLGHITAGADNHWYNGYKEQEWGGDFGLLKMGADTIPPVIGRAVMIDVAGFKKMDALPSNYAIGVKDLQDTLAAQKVDVEPGDIVMIRTGTLRYWGEAGEDQAKIAQHDSAGITLAAAKWLVEQKGAVMVGSDTSGLEVGTDPENPKIPNVVHGYLLVEQGVHIGEFHQLEGLARDKVYRFVYFASTNRFRGATAGFALRPVAVY
jgi:kynurenine formamidase